MAVSALRAIVDVELDSDWNVGQVLGQLCGLLTDIYQYWGAKVSQMRRRTVSLPDFGLRETSHAANPGRPPFVIESRTSIELGNDGRQCATENLAQERCIPFALSRTPTLMQCFLDQHEC